MVSRKTANVIAFVVFVALLIAGINVVILIGPTFDPPKKLTRVTETRLGPGTGKRTTEVEKGRERTHPPFSSKHTKSATTTIESPTGAPRKKQTVTVENGSRSFVERALGESGLIALQLAIVVLAAFLGAGLLHRALLGDFSVKLANLLELDAVQAASDSDAKLAAEVGKLTETVARVRKIQKRASPLLDKTVSDQKNAARTMVALSQKVVVLEEQVDKLKKRRTTSPARSKGKR